MAPVKRPEESVTVCRPRLVDTLVKLERESLPVRRPPPPGKAVQIYIHDPAWDKLHADLVNPPKTLAVRIKLLTSRIWTGVTLIVGGQ